MSLTKINSKLEFPKLLNMKNYLKDQTNTETEYKLKGVILHSGYA